MRNSFNILQRIYMSECLEINELSFDVDLIVLVKNKSMYIDSGWTLVLDCMAANFTFMPLAVELHYSSKKSHDPRMIDANKCLQIGNFYRVKGSALIWDDTQEQITLNRPEYKQVETNVLPEQFVKLLTGYLTDEDLCFQYLGRDDMKIQYNKSDLFPWID